MSTLRKVISIRSPVPDIIWSLNPKFGRCSPCSSSLSIPLHEQTVTGSIPGGDVKICYTLDRYVSPQTSTGINIKLRNKTTQWHGK